mmetsp:Transcript_106887/g.189964  ORF Transcript_106887/g.189964 Transcript_106887/m.189964 type:complete len:456 (+) Transcript_106887:31-1398(+)|eukprot:CAMPEP_0197640124 /NCGR_PEP_ID=MMETSP1338-20131121/14519_1 /TAXON_ID=43686 ORGANISM="Pelagodinium beii, Strain RCC1491" /NCGR_SAMPLE_ID=MMETSP1338 /ASSEMBLY_ACC=CAM_ASM_000754 /LENGTH=455 /DNA_ID=CAMNT_0043212939 /DNA_START=22 /DNA_END=1389 /DNA_ORIENTATION=-
MADDDPPQVVNVVGRHKERENQDLQGEYHMIGNVHGRPAYRKAGTRTVIRYWPVADRWLIDREGVQESDVCNAYAEQGGARHPAVEELVWRVWETQHRQHVRDPEFLVTAAPSAIQVLGRASGKENWALNGEYKLVGLHQGKVAYQKAGKFKHAIRYWRIGDRWLIDLEGLRDVDVCNAYADAQGTSFPGESRLNWHIWDSTRQRHVADSGLCTVVTPSCIELVGREAPKENEAMIGSYHLIGLHAGQPAYMKADGSGHAIRYWPREERWLIDLDGLRDTEVCNAYAEASGSGSHMHPGHLNVVWHVWETSRGRHLTDPAVRTFVAPHFVRLSGRDPYKENSTLNGDYELVKIVEGKPAYKKADSDHVIRYWPAEERWIIDLEAGFHGGDVANSFADAKGADNPGNSELLWYVWETSRGRHVADEDVIAEAIWLPQVDWSKVPGIETNVKKILDD